MNFIFLIYGMFILFSNVLYVLILQEKFTVAKILETGVFVKDTAMTGITDDSLGFVSAYK